MSQKFKCEAEEFIRQLRNKCERSSARWRVLDKPDIFQFDHDAHGRADTFDYIIRLIDGESELDER
jgi:hypothetical protein